MSVAQNSTASRLGEISRSNLQVLLATSLRRVPLAWARDHVAQTSLWSPRRESRTRTQCATLQLSLRRDGPTWVRLVGFRVWSRAQLTLILHKHTKTQYQHSKTMYNIPIHSNSTLNSYNMLCTHWRYLNSKITQRNHTIPQNPHPTLAKHKGLDNNIKCIKFSILTRIWHQFIPQSIQLTIETREHMQNSYTLNFSTPNLELLIKIEKVEALIRNPRLVQPLHTQTPLTLKFVLLSIAVPHNAQKPFLLPKLWLL